jgi:hypothetical protein
MTCAYDKIYLNNARAVLARMLDFAVYDLGYDIADFFDMFVKSGIAERFEKGDFEILSGKSGVEVAYEVTDICGKNKRNVKPRYTANRSEEYWLGWVLAYFQWETNLTFKEIVKNVPIKEMLLLYTPYHEMDVRQFCDKIKQMFSDGKVLTSQ